MEIAVPAIAPQGRLKSYQRFLEIDMLVKEIVAFLIAADGDFSPAEQDWVTQFWGYGAESQILSIARAQQDQETPFNLVNSFAGLSCTERKLFQDLQPQFDYLMNIDGHGSLCTEAMTDIFNYIHKGYDATSDSGAVTIISYGNFLRVDAFVKKIAAYLVAADGEFSPQEMEWIEDFWMTGSTEQIIDIFGVLNWDTFYQEIQQEFYSFDQEQQELVRELMPSLWELMVVDGEDPSETNIFNILYSLFGIASYESVVVKPINARKAAVQQRIANQNANPFSLIFQLSDTPKGDLTGMVLSQSETVRKEFDDWSQKIPFSPIRKLGTDTEMLQLVEYSNYSVQLDSRIEKRWLENREEPCSSLNSGIGGSASDIWSYSSGRFHSGEIELKKETGKAGSCRTCNAAGKTICSSCRGRGEKDHSRCSGRGWVHKTEMLMRPCMLCGGSGFNMAFETPCSACCGRGERPTPVQRQERCTCRNGLETCGRCSGSGKVTCGTCKGKKYMLSYKVLKQSFRDVEGDSSYIHPELPQFESHNSLVADLSGQLIADVDLMKETSLPFEGTESESDLRTHTNHLIAQQKSQSGEKLRKRNIKYIRCPIIMYQYRYGGEVFAAYLNRNNGMVATLDGPIANAAVGLKKIGQAGIENGDLGEGILAALKLVGITRGAPESLKLRKSLLSKALKEQVMFSVIGGMIGLGITYWICKGNIQSGEPLDWIVGVLGGITFLVLMNVGIIRGCIVSERSGGIRWLLTIISGAAALSVFSSHIGFIYGIILVLVGVVFYILQRDNCELLANTEAQLPVTGMGAGQLEQRINALEPSSRNITLVYASLVAVPGLLFLAQGGEGLHERMSPKQPIDKKVNLTNDALSVIRPQPFVVQPNTNETNSSPIVKTNKPSVSVASSPGKVFAWTWAVNDNSLNRFYVDKAQSMVQKNFGKPDYLYTPVEQVETQGAWWGYAGMNITDANGNKYGTAWFGFANGVVKQVRVDK